MGKLRNNQQGFTGIEGALVLAVIVIICLVGFVVFNSHKKTTLVAVATPTTTNSSSVAKSPVKTTKPAVDPYAGWKEFCSTAEKLCVKYPTDWQAVDALDSQSGKAFSIYSPTKKVAVDYSSLRSRSGSGEGGGPDSCTITTLTLAELNNKTTSLKAAKVVTDSKSTTPHFYFPYYYVTSDDFIASMSLKAGTASNTDNCIQSYTRIGDSKDSATISSLGMSQNRADNQNLHDFTSADEAKAWFETDEAVTAIKIVDSATFK
jgi:hypothetical protein